MRIQLSKGDKVFHSFIFLFLLICSLVILYPLIYIVSASLSEPYKVINGEVWLWPIGWNLDGYRAVFRNPDIVTGFRNSLIYMVLGTALSLIMTLLAAYPLSRKEFMGRSAVMGLFVFTMIFSGGLIPSYLVVKNLHLVDTIWAIVLPTAISAWNVIIARTFFQSTIPEELYESAQIDGSSDIGFLWRMVLPLSMPIIAVIGLYSAVGQWNTYFSALIYLHNAELFPLQIILRNILITNQINPLMISNFDSLKAKQGLVDIVKYAIIVVASLPIIAIYPFVQRYFVKGIMIGAIKG